MQMLKKFCKKQESSLFIYEHTVTEGTNLRLVPIGAWQ